MADEPRHEKVRADPPVGGVGNPPPVSGVEEVIAAMQRYGVPKTQVVWHAGKIDRIIERGKWINRLHPLPGPAPCDCPHGRLGLHVPGCNRWRERDKVLQEFYSDGAIALL